MRKFIRLTDSEEVNFMDQVNAKCTSTMYKIVKNGLACGIWKKVNSRLGARFVYINLEFQSGRQNRYFEKGGRFSICISTDLQNIAIVDTTPFGKLKLLYFPKALNYHWYDFWFAYSGEVRDLKTSIINMIIFFQSIDLIDVDMYIFNFLCPEWAVRIIKENVFFSKYFPFLVEKYEWKKYRVHTSANC